MREVLSGGQDKRAGPDSPKPLSAHRFLWATAKSGVPSEFAFQWVAVWFLAGSLPPNTLIMGNRAL